MKALGGLIVLILLAIVALNIYLSTRPAAKTMKAAGIIPIPTPFHMRRPFIDYMTISGSRLYAGHASEGLVGVVDTASNQTWLRSTDSRESMVLPSLRTATSASPLRAVTMSWAYLT